MHDKLGYDAFRELFKFYGINPYDFRVLAGDSVYGYFPDLPEREPSISVDLLAFALFPGK